ncbi:MAG: hypothetical protein KDE33_05005 [Bacteroidetes bacterium]|nr:hypothetical protein [Bacteroidota bacterium]
MKKITIALLLPLIIFSILSCSSDDSFLEPNTIAGNWHMVRYEHSNGENINFTKNDIVWIFDENSDQLTVEINFSMATLNNYESISIGIDEGTYDYSIIEKNGVLNLTIGNLEFGNITLSENELTVNRKQGEYGNGNDLSTWYFEK